MRTSRAAKLAIAGLAVVVAVLCIELKLGVDASGSTITKPAPAKRTT